MKLYYATSQDLTNTEAVGNQETFALFDDSIDKSDNNWLVFKSELYLTIKIIN